MISYVCSAPSSSSPSASLSLSPLLWQLQALLPRATMRRDRMERFVILPFSIGCVSQSSVAVIDNGQPEKTRGEAKPPPEPSPQGETIVVVLATDATRTSSSSDSHPRRSNNISVRLNKLVKSFKGLSSHLLAVYRVDEDEGEAEMEIGFPTDVKHVGHIGWDGGLPAPASKASTWDVGGGAPELISLPSISFRQFELAMSAQAEAPVLAPTGGVEVA